MTIQLTTDGTTLTVTGSPEIVCNNTDYDVQVTGAAALTDPLLRIICEQDGQTSDTYTVELTDGAGAFPAISRAWGVWAAVEHAEGTTERVWLPCRESIKSAAGRAYSAPYDVYNAALEYAAAAHNGSATPEQLAAMRAALQNRYENPPAYPGTAYKRAIAASVRETKLSGKLTLTGGTEIDITDENIVESSLAISTSAVSDDYLLPGGVPSKELAATLRGDLPDEQIRGAVLEPEFWLRLESGRWFKHKLGAFTIMRAGDDTTKGIPVTAYDDMRKLDRVTAGELGFTQRKGYSPNQIITICCNKAGIEYTQNVDFDDRFVNVNTHSYVAAAVGPSGAWGWLTVIVNADEIEDVQAALDEMYHGLLTYRGDVDYPNQLTKTGVEVFDAFLVRYGGPVYLAWSLGANVETARDVLMHTLFTVGGIAEINPDRQLIVKPLERAHDEEELDENRTHRRAVSRLPYKTYALTMPIEYLDADEVKQTTVRREESMWSDVYVNAEAQTNALWTTLNQPEPQTQWDAITSQMTALVDVCLDPVTFYPGRIDMYGDPTIGLLDWVTPGDDRPMPVTGSVWRYRGQQQLTACGSDAVANALTSQLEKSIVGNKVEASQQTQNMMRRIYGHLMQSYRGMQNFKYSDVEHYTYEELEGGTIT